MKIDAQGGGICFRLLERITERTAVAVMATAVILMALGLAPRASKDRTCAVEATKRRGSTEPSIVRQMLSPTMTARRSTNVDSATVTRTRFGLRLEMNCSGVSPSILLQPAQPVRRLPISTHATRRVVEWLFLKEALMKGAMDCIQAMRSL